MIPRLLIPLAVLRLNGALVLIKAVLLLRIAVTWAWLLADVFGSGAIE